MSSVPTKTLSDKQQRLYRLLGEEPPKPAHPVLVRIYGYPLAIIINQILFWDGKGARTDGYIFKTEDDFIKEVGISSAQQKLAIKIGKAFGFLDVRRKGVPGKRHYKIDFEALIDSTLAEANRKSIELSKGHFDAGEKRRYITERTQDTTTNKTIQNSIGSIIDKRYGKR